jgi:hypothetical protein
MGIAASFPSRLAALTDPAERQRVERYFARLEEPLLADTPPDDWAADNPEAVLRDSVVERPLGLRM